MDILELERRLLPLGIGTVGFSLIDSTSSEAKRRALAGLASSTLFIAEEQTAGRGRMGRSFFSPADTGLYLSLLFPVGEDSLKIVGITSAAAVAAVRAIRSETGIETGIKWVNDIYLGSRKIAGILAESFFVGEKRFCIVGIGVNLTTENSDFPSELRNSAGSLMTQGDIRTSLAAVFCEELWGLVSALPDKSFMEEYRAASVVIGQEITFLENGAQYSAIAKKVCDDGSLEVVLDSGESRVLSSGEISLRLK